MASNENVPSDPGDEDNQETIWGDLELFGICAKPDQSDMIVEAPDAEPTEGNPTEQEPPVIEAGDLSDGEVLSEDGEQLVDQEFMIYQPQHDQTVFEPPEQSENALVGNEFVQAINMPASPQPGPSGRLVEPRYTGRSQWNRRGRRNRRVRGWRGRGRSALRFRSYRSTIRRPYHAPTRAYCRNVAFEQRGPHNPPSPKRKSVPPSPAISVSSRASSRTSSRSRTSSSPARPIYKKLPQRVVNGSPNSGPPALACQVVMKGEADRRGKAYLTSLRFAINAFVPPWTFAQTRIEIPGFAVSCHGKGQNTFMSVHDEDMHVPWKGVPRDPRQTLWRSMETKRPPADPIASAPLKFEAKLELRLWSPSDRLELLHAVLDADYVDNDVQFDFTIGGNLKYMLDVGAIVSVAILDG